MQGEALDSLGFRYHMLEAQDVDKRDKFLFEFGHCRGVPCYRCLLIFLNLCNLDLIKKIWVAI